MKVSATQSLGCYELKDIESQFDEVLPKLLDKRKNVKLQWLQNANQTYGGNLENIIRESNTTFSKYCMEY